MHSYRKLNNNWHSVPAISVARKAAMTTLDCTFCSYPLHVTARWCPHCALPSLFPNVRIVSSSSETAALDARYEAAYEHAKETNKDFELRRFEEHVATSSACKALPSFELERLLSSDSATASTYYQQICGRSRIPDTDKWDRLRRIADAAFFQGTAEEIHFAALSTDNRWLSHYGDGAIFFRDDMIAYRATVFEANTAVWLEKCTGALNIPPGTRATWERRAQLAVAKLAEDVCTGTICPASLLLSSGSNSAEDSFIEVHICGGFTIRTASKILIKQEAVSPLFRARMLEKAKSLGIELVEVK